MKNIAIIMGGYSSEYKISLISGSSVYNNLDKVNITVFVFTFSKKMGVR
jgi:D-alanine-D-alanine ligase